MHLSSWLNELNLYTLCCICKSHTSDHIPGLQHSRSCDPASYHVTPVHWVWISSSGFIVFPLPSFCLQYPRLVFPPTLPIILDAITHHNVTHKGKWLLRLETDPSLDKLLLHECLESRHFMTDPPADAFPLLTDVLFVLVMECIEKQL